MSDEDWRTGGRREAETRLARLADLLDCPTEVFTAGADAPRAVRQLRDLIALWNDIDDLDDRDQLIAEAHRLANP